MILRPRVLAILGTRTACELYRILFPFRVLREKGYPVGWVTMDRLPTTRVSDWDILVLPRLGLRDIEVTRLFLELVRTEGKILVYEMDDDLLHIPPWNPAHLSREQIRTIVALIEGSDLVTVSTEHLGEVIREINPRVEVLPNCIDPRFWEFPRGAGSVRVVAGTTVGVMGGNSHLRDWEILVEVFPEVARRCPEVRFVVAGYHPPYIVDLRGELGDRLVLLEWVDLPYYPGLVAQIDIGLCPLQDGLFNRSKSPIKAMEYAMVGGAVVASPVVYGELIRDGLDGFLARRPEEWVERIETLVRDPQRRRLMAERLRTKVLRERDVRREAIRWWRVYHRLWVERRRNPVPGMRMRR